MSLSSETKKKSKKEERQGARRNSAVFAVITRDENRRNRNGEGAEKRNMEGQRKIGTGKKGRALSLSLSLLSFSFCVCCF